MATKKNRRRRLVRSVNMDRVPDTAAPHEAWATDAITRTATMVFGGAEVLTVGLLRFSSRLVTSALTGAIAVGTQAGALAVDAVQEAISDARDVARDVAARAGTPGQGRVPAGTRRRVSAPRAEERHTQPVTELSPPAA
jgi:hypothetical protein